jgi:fumarylacetoacetase
VPDGGFGQENLPWGVVQSSPGQPRPAVRLGGDAILLEPLRLASVPPETFSQGSLNRFIELGPGSWAAVRQELQQVILAGRDEPHRVPLAELRNAIPVAIGDYVDFYASLEHASNLGRMFRPDSEPLLPNWRHLPVGYHGRAGTVVVSGTPVRRPCGQRPSPDAGPPSFGPERRLDFEIELGFITGTGPPLGTPIPVTEAERYIFGFVLVNDWSARELQRWEYQPLGPFLGKSFATSISPWIVPLDAVRALRVSGPPQDPTPLEYLRTDQPWALDIELEGELNGTVITRTNARGLYWNVAQQLAHATVNGASVAAGDLFASGTISGTDPGSCGSLIELSWGGRDPVRLQDGSERTFLHDGDVMLIRARGGTISFGVVSGRIEPAQPA